MKKKHLLLFVALVLSFQTYAQNGININSLARLTGLNDLQNLIPQVVSQATAVQAAGVPPTTTDPADPNSLLTNEQSVEFLNTIQGAVLQSVLDSLQINRDAKKDSLYNSDIFGHNFFRMKNLNVFTKSESFKAPESYILDVGDEISLSVFGSSVFNVKGEISEDGYVDFKQMGRAYLKGLTLGAARKLVTNLVGKYVNLKTSQVEIVLNYSRNITVNIVGDVYEPGSYVIPAINSVFNALVAAKGPNKIGSVRNIQVLRNGEVVATFDLYDFLLKGKFQADFYLQDGDFIFVPTLEKIADIKGGVRRPFKYELLPEENLADLFELAGGFTANSYAQNVQVQRFILDEVEILDVDLASVAKGSNFALKDGDKINVPNILENYQNYIDIKGAVYFPGRYQIKEGQRIDDLIKAAGGLTVNAFLDKAFLTRKDENLNAIIQEFNVGDVVNGQAGENVLLQRHDLIEIFSKEDFLQEFQVSIDGAVLKPVKKTYAKGMTLNDMIFYGGGLKKEAASNLIEISRVVDQGTDGEATLTRVVVKTVGVDADLNIDSEAKAFELSPMDQIFVRKNPDFFEQMNVTIQGEVKYPGVYPIMQKDEKVLDLIERAGGLTPFAFLQSAKLYRTDKTIGTVVIDLEEAFRSPDSRANSILREGDILEIPMVNQLVSVKGAIGHPELDSLGTISSLYMPGRRAKYYIKNYGGGFDRFAKRKTTKVVNPDGSASYTKKVLFFNRYPEVKEGAIVSVEYSNKMNRIKKREEAEREPVNWNLLLPSVIVSTTSVLSSTILVLTLRNNN